MEQGRDHGAGVGGPPQLGMWAWVAVRESNTRTYSQRCVCVRVRESAWPPPLPLLIIVLHEPHTQPPALLLCTRCPFVQAAQLTSPLPYHAGSPSLLLIPDAPYLNCTAHPFSRITHEVGLPLASPALGPAPRKALLATPHTSLYAQLAPPPHTAQAHP